jgi:hypothetical protein
MQSSCKDGQIRTPWGPPVATNNADTPSGGWSHRCIRYTAMSVSQRHFFDVTAMRKQDAATPSPKNPNITRQVHHLTMGWIRAPSHMQCSVRNGPYRVAQPCAEFPAMLALPYNAITGDDGR